MDYVSIETQMAHNNYTFNKNIDLICTKSNIMLDFLLQSV